MPQPQPRRDQPAEPTVDILLTVYNGMPYLNEQIRSLQAQTHASWRLWVRDDGSTDGTVDELRTASSEDARIRLLEADGHRLGALAGFTWLLDHAAPDAEYLMFCDADDVWLPTKIELTLRAMRENEVDPGTGEVVPVLVHTDLTVVDAELAPLSDSFWHFEGIRPASASLNRLLVQNSVTGCTVMINSALRAIAAPVPPQAVMHDWWLALAASCLGRIVSLPVPTLLYRQHGRNDTGARAYPRGALPTLKRGLAVALRTADVRRALARSANQAAALLDRLGDRLSPEQRRLIGRYSEIVSCGSFARKLRLLELKTLTHGWDRTLGLILRA